MSVLLFFFFKHKTAYEMRISDWSSDVCSSDLGGSLQHDQKKLLAGFGRMVCDYWREPDHGIWEIRDRKRHYTFSKLMCWVALDRLLEIDPIEGLGIPRNRFEEERSAIAEAIEARGFNGDLAASVGELDGDRMDASLLLMPSLGYGNPEGSGRAQV